MIDDGQTCEQCRHWHAQTQRGYRIDGRLERQAHCKVDYPTVYSSPLRWHWDKCARFEPDMRAPQEAA